MPAIDLNHRFILDEQHDEGVTIHGIDTCIRKPLVITVGSDHTVHVYDYEDGRRRFAKTFPEEPHSVSFHPSGMHALVGFSDKLRLVHVLADDVRPFWETSIKCRGAAGFSRGGQAFAAAHGPLISVFDFYRGTKTCDLRGHNARVCRIVWSRGDSSLLSLDEDGNVYRWDVESGRRVGEHALRCGPTHSSYAAVSREAVWAISHGSLEEISQKNLTHLKTVGSDDQGIITGPLIASNEESSMVFVGISTKDPDGLADAVRIYSVIQGDFVDFPGMGNFSILHASHDDRYLFVVKQTGRIAVLEVNDRRGYSQVLITAERESRSRTEPSWCQNVLISETSLEEQQAVANDLRGRIDELKTESAYQLRLREKAHDDKIKKTKEGFQQESEHEKQRLGQVDSAVQEMSRHHKERMQQMVSNHDKELARVEIAHRDKLLAEVDRYQQETAEWNLQLKEFEEQKQRLIEAHQRCFQELERELQNNLRAHQGTRVELEEQLDDLKKTLHETRRQLEEDVDTGIQRLKQRYEDKLSKERDTFLTYAGENGILHKKTAATLKDIEDHKEMVKVKLGEREDMRDNIISLGREIESLRVAVKEKEDVSVSRDSAIRRLEKKKDELNKFKYVLDDKIREYAGQMQPRDNEAMQIKEQVKKLSQTLDHYRKENSRLETVATELTQQIDQQQKRVTTNMKKMSTQDAHCKRLLGGLDDCTQLIQKPDELTKKVKSLRARIKAGAPSSEEEEKFDSHGELVNRRDGLERDLIRLKEKQAKCAATNQKERDAARKVNEDLLEKINILRESNKKERQALRKQQEEIQNAPFKSRAIV